MITWILLALAVVTALLYSKWCHGYWARKGVPIAQGCIPFFGHSLKLMGLFSKRVPRWKLIDEIYRKQGGSTFCGLYESLNPILLVGDPDLIKAICIKDSDHFVDRRRISFPNPKDKYFVEMLSNASGSHWKGMRSVLSPCFSSGRIKGVFPLVENKADNLVAYCNQRLERGTTMTMKKTFGLFTMEVIASAAFGYDLPAFTDEDNIFLSQVASLSKYRFKKVVSTFLLFFLPRVAAVVKPQFSSDAVFFFAALVTKAVEERKGGVERGDFLDIMMEVWEENKEAGRKAPKYCLSESTIISTSVLFILAGMETSSLALSFTSYLLAKHPEIQQKLRKEIRDIIQRDGSLTYYGIMEAKYLHACISETLRIHPPAHFTERHCSMDYKLPGTNVTIKKDMMVLIPSWSLHHDERYWSDPERYDPERFMPENKHNINAGTYLPFGLGPRNCIGMRFAQMEIKLALAKLIQNFELSCAPGHEELKFAHQPFMMKPLDDITLTLTPITK